MEVDALYCDVIVQRWEQFMGLTAERIPGACDDQGEERSGT